MPRIDVDALPATEGTVYPQRYAAIVEGRSKKRLGDAAGLTQFGVNLTRLKPGAASAHRHWHSSEDELIYILEGEATLVEDACETILGPGDSAAFKAGVANGHHLINRSTRDVVYLEVGARSETDVCTYTDPDVDMKFVRDRGERRMLRRDGSPP